MYEIRLEITANRAGNYSCEASTLHLPAGQVIKEFKFLNQEFYFLKTLRDDDEIAGWEYLSTTGLKFTIWND